MNEVTIDPRYYLDWDGVPCYFCPNCGSDWITPEDEHCLKCNAKIIWKVYYYETPQSE